MPSIALTRRALASRISRHTAKLLDAQLALALGSTALYKRNPYTHEPERVTDRETIESYLRGERPELFCVEAIKPDNRAIDSLLDRAFGKPAPTDDQNARPSVVVIVGQGTAAIGPSPWDGATVVDTRALAPPSHPTVPSGDRIRQGAPRRSRP